MVQWGKELEYMMSMMSRLLRHKPCREEESKMSQLLRTHRKVISKTKGKQTLKDSWF